MALNLAELLEAGLDVRADSLHQKLYAQDASVYEHQPLGVAFPRTADELVNLVALANEARIPLVPRAAGTSLAGQATGPGLVVDTGRHMTRILELNREEGWVRVEPGVILDELNRYLSPFDLFFGPDTSTSNRCMIGGMIGNNSCGSHSILYGNTMAHVLELEVVFADGTREVLKDWSDDELLHHSKRQDALGAGLRELLSIENTHREEIEASYPPRALVRRNTGYPLDDFIWRTPKNLGRFLCGTEGTLAFTVSAKLSLVPKPKHKILVCAQFHDLIESLEATVLAVSHNPAAVELIDRRILEQTKSHLEHQHNRFFVEGDPDAVLVIEFYRDTVAETEEAASRLIESLQENGMGYAWPIVRTPDDKRVWELRKAGLGLLMGVPGDTKAVSVVEDTAVPVENLPAYVKEFQRLMEKYETQSVYHAHASVGELHLRPELNLKELQDVQKFKDIARETALLVKSFRGSLSGEHGDGRVRSPLIREFFGDEVYELHQRVKSAFDPNNILNPGIIVNAHPIDLHFRVEPGSTPPELEATFFDWSSDLGFMRALEKCNGAGACRKLPDAGGTMCPSYMATLDEKDSTRGRANIFRQVFLNQPESWMTDEDLADALDLCLSCKACKSECPASVDMARMKAEFSQHRADAGSQGLRSKFFGNYTALSKLGALLPGLSNAGLKFGPARQVMNHVLKIAPERSIPEFGLERASTWLKRRAPAAHKRSVWLFVDPFTEFNDPHLAKEATLCLEALGFRVDLLPIEDDGRTFISKGMLRQAKALTNQNLQTLRPLLDQSPQKKIVGIEPSALLTLRDETPDLADKELKPVAQDLAKRALLFDEFITEIIDAGDFPDLEHLGEKVVFHGHCHQKALSDLSHTTRLLKLSGYDVKVLKTGCCGMAGSFGYEAEHYELSMKIGELQLFPALRQTDANTWIVATGTSCRHQIKDGVSRDSVHPVQLLSRALRLNAAEP